MSEAKNTPSQPGLVPFVGAEVFIEPGQSPEEITGWFSLLKECGMTVTRIRLFENYMHRADGTWDFSLFDSAFEAAEKYGVAVYGNLFPATGFTDVGGFKFPHDEANLAGIASYIERVVSHFSRFSSLCGWVPINEPGMGAMPETVFSRDRFETWKQELAAAEYFSKGYTSFDFHEQRFLLHHTTWFLGWLCGEIRKYDPHREIHVNNHALFQHVAEYDFPAWTQFLDSLGGSAHASWHFGYFERAGYAAGMSAKSEIIRSGAGNIPWFMTELQGGNNIYSAFHPLCPTPEEISQWLWLVIATGGRGAIFWCLNARGSGFEAGEWAMLNFQDEPSDRMLAAAAVSKTISGHAGLFSNTSVDESGISILYTRESLWVEKALQISGTEYEGRMEGGVMKSSLAWFEALGEMGVQANFKEIGEFDFDRKNFSGETLILSHQVSIPSRYWEKLEHFVASGGKLIADGLTGFYDENAHCVMKTGFSLETVFGACLKEVKMVANLFTVDLDASTAGIPRLISLPAHLWRGTLKLITASPVALYNDEAIACRNGFGNGSVLWIPSLAGLGCRIRKDYSTLARLLNSEARESLFSVQCRLEGHQPGVIMKTLRSGGRRVSVVVNKSGTLLQIPLLIKNASTRGSVIFANGGGSFADRTATVHAEETMVIAWS